MEPELPVERCRGHIARQPAGDVQHRRTLALGSPRVEVSHQGAVEETKSAGTWVPAAAASAAASRNWPMPSHGR